MLPTWQHLIDRELLKSSPWPLHGHQRLLNLPSWHQLVHSRFRFSREVKMKERPTADRVSSCILLNMEDETAPGRVLPSQLFPASPDLTYGVSARSYQVWKESTPSGPVVLVQVLCTIQRTCTDFTGTEVVEGNTDLQCVPRLHWLAPSIACG
jgi:hypothetical protein